MKDMFKKIFVTVLSVVLITEVLNVNIYAKESAEKESISIEEYCSSEEYSIEGLKELFPEYYRKCQIEYEIDKKEIAEINKNMDSLIREGKRISRIEYKNGYRDAASSSLGSKGDILVTLTMNSGSAGFAGHAIIVSANPSVTVESYAKSFSPIGKDGVQYYTNNWGTKSGTLLVRPKGATSTQYQTAASFAASKVGLPYNWNFFNKTTTEKYYCSQLVWQAWLAAGIDVETGSTPNGIISPADLVNSSNTYIVSKVK